MLLQIITTFGASSNEHSMDELTDEYTSLIMEELDPDNLRYVKVCPILLMKNNMYDAWYSPLLT
jgi:hypothetical protein